MLLAEAPPVKEQALGVCIISKHNLCKRIADAIAFVDDDEVPSPGWLKYLAACLESYGADAAAGPGMVRVWMNVYSPRGRSAPASPTETRRAIMTSEGAALA